jgi:hypothetical protein
LGNIRRWIEGNIFLIIGVINIHRSLLIEVNTPV